MNIVAMLAWWDEPPEELDACVRSLTVLCDAVVAVDGGYEMTPGATPASPRGQAESILAAAAEMGLRATVVVPDRVWTGQVAKRDFMLRLAALDADWLLAVDADHRLVGNRDPIRDELQRFGPYVDTVLHDFYTPYPRQPGKLLEEISPHEWHTKLAGKTVEHCLLIRRMEDMHVTGSHWGYSGVREDGVRVSLGGWREEPTGRHRRLTAPFQVDHVCFMRDQMRLDRNRDYCRIRDEFAETHGYEP